jgi:hypothetical protein
VRDTGRLPSNPVDSLNECGFAILRVFDEAQVGLLERYAKDWVYRLLAKWTSGKEATLPLDAYHLWSKSLDIAHGDVFVAENRHGYPAPEIEEILLNDKIKGFLHGLGVEHFEAWDEGLGWLGFRLIRPGVGDGYPFSRKAWGVAKHVISCWVPIIGYSPSETLTLVPGSHLKDYEKHRPMNHKFRKDEYYLKNVPADMERYNPELARGEVIFFHPKVLHSEDVISSSVTRLNLEYRLNPL